MLYFIPAWYSGDGWREDEQCWYRRRTRTETDDTVKQIQLFQRNPICPYRILLLSHAPNFRHFLHRQGTFRVPYWSVFDAIQEVRRRKQALFSFRDLAWPGDVEFLYTPFTILARRAGERYASVEFGEYGNLIRVDLYRDGALSRQNLYDDRGFLSCTCVYEGGERVYDQYMTDKGVWKLRHFADGSVRVNPESCRYLTGAPEAEARLPFRKTAYASMEEVVGEVLEAFLRTTGREDLFCAAAHPRHLPLLDRLLADRRRVYSVFGNRLPPGCGREALSRGDCLVADSEETLEILSREACLASVEKRHIPPYDTRIEPGISQQLRVQKILLPVDHLPGKTLEAAVRAMAAYLRGNGKARVCLFTRNAALGWEDELLARVRELLERSGYPPEWAGKAARRDAEVLPDAGDRIPVMFTVEQCVDELSVNKCVREQRLLVDLADRPDLFLQILCVGVGIPQIVRTATEYLRPGENGRINREISRLGEDLAYYLDSLRNWNQAAIRSYELGETHTAQNLIDLWKEVIDHVEGGTGAAAGEDGLQQDGGDLGAGGVVL